MANVRMRVLPRLLPQNGREVELQTNETHIQWRYVAGFSGEFEWQNLIALDALKGPAGPALDLRVEAGFVQYAVAGTDVWTDLIDVADIVEPAFEARDAAIVAREGAEVAQVASEAARDLTEQYLDTAYSHAEDASEIVTGLVIANQAEAEAGDSAKIMTALRTRQAIEGLAGYVTQLGAVSDGAASYNGSGWDLTPGTDIAPLINAAISAGTMRTFHFPPGVWTCSQLKVTSNISFVGPTSAFEQGQADGGGAALIFIGGADEDFIVPHPSAFEASQFLITGFNVFDGRAAPTGGYAINMDKAVNSVHIKRCMLREFPDGSAFVGSSDNARAGDNIHIDECWVQIGPNTGHAIGVGNFNNTCRIENIYCDGEGEVIKRTNGSELAGVFVVESIKHESHDHTGASIALGANDLVFAAGITRRSYDAAPSDGGVVIQPVSSRGSYLNVVHANVSGNVQRTAFKDGSGNAISTAVNAHISRMGPTVFARESGSVSNIVSDWALDGSAWSPALRLFKSSIERIRLSTLVKSFLTYFVNSDAVLEVGNTSSTSAIGIIAKTASGGGGAALVADRTASNGRIVEIRKNSTVIGAIGTADGTSVYVEWINSGPRDYAGAGTPEGVLAAPKGSTFRRTDGGAGTSFYVKESGTGNTGWAAK